MSGKIAVDLIVGDTKNNEYTRDFNNNSTITLDTSISELKTQLDEFFRTKGQQIVFFEAGRDGSVFSNDMNAKLQNFANNIMLREGKIWLNRPKDSQNFFNVAIDLQPLSAQGAGRRRRKTLKKRKLGKKRRTNKKRRVYRKK